jgi:hypothetical protein
MTRKLHIAVLMGGWSAEREVSLVTGNGVADALESRGHRVTRIDMDRDVARRLAEVRPEIVFNALHGTPGEDGTVQGLMDLMGLKYTHSGLETSVIAIDKELTKMVLVPHGIRMPALPIPSLLPQFEVFTPQTSHLGTQLSQFLAEERKRLRDRRPDVQFETGFQKQVFHDLAFLPTTPTRWKGQLESPNGLGEALLSICHKSLLPKVVQSK